MINFVFIPGCYGNYLASCIVLYSDLTSYDIEIPGFSPNGNSHKSTKSYINNQINCIHSVDKRQNNDQYIFVEPLISNQLDYLDNQLEKQFNNNIDDHLKSLNLFDAVSSAALWEKREIASFWIGDLLHNSQKNFENYYTDDDCIINVSDIFDNINGVLQKTLKHLNLSKNINDIQIIKRHNEFLKKQKNHMIQQIILDWVECIINGEDKESPCKTFFDEAYVQFQLRKKGHEIKCYELDKFPSNSLELHLLLT